MDGVLDEVMLRDRYRACVLAAASGDAIGKCVETMDPAAILNATDGRGITGFHPSLQQAFETAQLAPEQTTDDTQHGSAGARSLIRMRGFDLDDQARERIIIYHQRANRGWGKSTEIGIGELAVGKRKPGDPVVDSKAHGTGNGIAMQVWSLALATAPRVTGRSPGEARQTLSAWIRQLASLTHRDPCAAIGAEIIGVLIQDFLGVHPQRLDRDMVHTAIMCAAIGCESCPNHRSEFERRIFELPQTRNVGEVAALTGTRSTVYESIPFVCGILLHHWHDLRGGILAAVNQGGDADSTAAMVGAILGALHGTAAIPQAWSGVEAADELTALADGLFDLAIAQR